MVVDFTPLSLLDLKLSASVTRKEPPMKRKPSVYCPRRKMKTMMEEGVIVLNVLGLWRRGLMEHYI